MKNIVLILAVFILSACGSGGKYVVDVGCTDDMRQYREERQQLIDEKAEEKRAREIELECRAQEEEK